MTNARSKNAKVISPDELYIIFGNSEFRIKSGDGVAFSNLGVNTSFFNSHEKGFSVYDLLGNKPEDGDSSQAKREVELVTYEFYQVLFS